MKSLFSLIFLFLFANSAVAANLCDTSCNLTITFPTGGTIEATEALTFTFGTGGVLDLGVTGTINVAVPPASTDFSAGGTLALAVGESISFDAGGSLDLGVGGAIDFNSITVTTDGEFDLQIDSVADTVYVGDITINGTGKLKISVTGSNLELGALSTGGDLVITSTGNINVVGAIVAFGSITFDAGGSISATNFSNNLSSVSLTSNGSISISDIGLTECTTSSDGSVTISTTTSPTISTCNTLTLGGTITYLPPLEILINPITTIINTIQLEPLVDGDVVTFWDGRTCVVQGEQCIAEDGTIYKIIDSMSVIDPYIMQDPMLNGITVSTKDGGTCTVTDGKCIAENGAEYKMNEDGQLVPVESGSGSVNIAILLFTFFSLLYAHRFTLGRI